MSARKNKFDLVFSKFKIGKKTIKNRLIASPISINMADKKGFVTKNIIDFFTNLGNSGVGMVTVGAASINSQGSDTINGMIIGDKKYENKLKKLNLSIKETGCLSAIQIFHVGSQGNPLHNGGYETVGPTSYYFKDIDNFSRELTKKEILKIEDDFVQSIISAINCRFDFIELHLAHGYLLHQFLSPYFNKRTDEYGGNFDNNFRIINNIFKKLSNLNIKYEGRIGFRVSANDYVKDGLNLTLIKKIILKLSKFKPAYFSVTAGLYETAKFKYIDMKNGKYWDYARKIKKFSKTTIIAQGGITNLNEAKKILLNTKSDLIGMAQSLIADPKIIEKTINEETEKIIPCMAHINIGSCHRCRYIKQKNLTFACITPTSWTPKKKIISDYERKKDLKIWKKLNEKIYKNKFNY